MGLKRQSIGIELCALLTENAHFFYFTGVKKYILYILKERKGKNSRKQEVYMLFYNNYIKKKKENYLRDR